MNKNELETALSVVLKLESKNRESLDWSASHLLYRALVIVREELRHELNTLK